LSPPVSVPAKESAAGAHILLVEDNEDNVLLTGMLLDRLHHTYEVAHNGRVALEMYQKGNWDLVLMDIQMPEMDGLEATRRIREVEERDRCHTPIVALTAMSMPEDNDRCKAAGMDDYLRKPISVDKLRTTIDRWL